MLRPYFGTNINHTDDDDIEFDDTDDDGDIDYDDVDSDDDILNAAKTFLRSMSQQETTYFVGYYFEFEFT